MPGMVSRRTREVSSARKRGRVAIAGLSGLATVAAGLVTLFAAAGPAQAATDVWVSGMLDCKITRVSDLQGDITKFSVRCRAKYTSVNGYYIAGWCNGRYQTSGEASANIWGYGASVYLNCSSGFTKLQVFST
ncbi:hypothetical protein ACIBEJ_22790 [Nonomuraea sp. NPDC050790]|uniref:hypothetical protein n=1 Tax=Nonomuraea sp. NPDC050790 TaxID=3364371 RepID=UPI003790EB26